MNEEEEGFQSALHGRISMFQLKAIEDVGTTVESGTESKRTKIKL